jgi:predicted ester cyclase
MRNLAIQEATPAAMSVEETQEVMTDYASALLGGGDFGQYLAEDVAVRFMDVRQEMSGRQAVVDSLITLHTVQFDAQPEIVTTVVGEGSAAIEALFVGTHTDEFAGIPATGMTVSVHTWSCCSWRTV